MSASEFFKYFGIAIAVMLVDFVVCCVSAWISGQEDEEDRLIVALVINFIGFASVLAILIGERLG